MKKSRTFFIVVALAVVLTIMLGVSAYLQYQWLNQLSVAEEVRIRTSMENAAHQFGGQVNQEMMAALFTFVVPAPGNKDELAARLSERSLEWSATASHPGLVKNIYWVEHDEIGTQLLFVYSQEEEKLQPVSDWAKVGDSYPSLEAFFEGDIVSPVPFSRRGLDAVPVIPFDAAVRTMQDHLFIVFDKAYISESWIPELVSRFFNTFNQEEYDIFITAREAIDQVVYASNFDVQPHEETDVKLAIGPPDPQFMLRFLTRIMARSSLPREMPGMFRGGQRGEPPPGIAPLRIWTLYITHKSGALKTAVAHVRTRNLGISFMVLIVLGASIALILVYTRRMQKLANQQMAFVAGVSHDIKTPIAVMHAVGENMRDGLVIEADETREYGAFIVDQSRSLLNTANQVLSYAGITVGSSSGVNNVVDVNRVIQLALSRVEIDLEDADIDLDLDAALPGVLGDEEALTSVVQNLVQNAIKYSGDRPYVMIATDIVEGRIRLSVEDKGRGIAPEDEPYIFEPFYRGADARSSQIRGNGLGLSIVKNIVEAHKGTITCQSVPGQGATFYITIPSQ